MVAVADGTVPYRHDIIVKSDIRATGWTHHKIAKKGRLYHELNIDAGSGAYMP